MLPTFILINTIGVGLDHRKRVMSIATSGFMDALAKLAAFDATLYTKRAIM